MISTLIYSLLIVSSVAALAFYLGRSFRDQPAPVSGDQTLSVLRANLKEILNPVIDRAVKEAVNAYMPEPVEGPKIVVNVPPDFKGMTSLPPSEVQGAAAVLWYSAYLASINLLNDNGTVDSDDMVNVSDIADQAVRVVFGPPKP